MKNIFRNGFIHEKVPGKFKLASCRGKVVPGTLSSFNILQHRQFIPSLFGCCLLKNVLLVIYLTTNEWFLDDNYAVGWGVK